MAGKHWRKSNRRWRANNYNIVARKTLTAEQAAVYDRTWLWFVPLAALTLWWLLF
jgi:hypothetical protein